MSVVTAQLSEGPVSVGCYRRRLVDVEGEFAFTTGRSLIRAGKTIFGADSEIMDVAKFQDKVVMITAKGDVYCGDDVVSRIGGQVGVYAGIEVLEHAIVGVHDLSHTLRVIDPTTMESTRTMNVRGTVGGLCSVSDDSVLILDDRTLALVDLKSDSVSARSPPLPAQPVAVIHHNGTAIISCDDRRIRVYDIRKMKAPLLTTKPTTKNGAMSLYTRNGTELVCVGCDESMTLIDTAVKVGHRKRNKHLVESPWVGAPVVYGDDVALLTRNGFMHRFTGIEEFLKGIVGDDSSDGE